MILKQWEIKQLCFFAWLNNIDAIIKGLVHPKMKILSLITHPFQARKTFVLLQNINEDIFDEIWELSVPFKAQKKNLVKIVHVTAPCNFIKNIFICVSEEEERRSYGIGTMRVSN